jgi:molybdate transport system ATP-binding protein
MRIDIALKGSVGQLAMDAVFEVPASGITVIWGPSGAGKTTLLRAIAGLQRLSGHVRIGDIVWQDGLAFVPVHKRRLGYAFQEPSLFAHLNVKGNVFYPLRRAGRRRFVLPLEPGERGVRAAKLIRLQDRLVPQAWWSREIATLSGGERQRVALARVLMASPEILLMDEPLSSLDTAAKAELLPLIKQIGEQTPILYVTHDPAEVAALADRVLHMTDGRVMPGKKTASLEELSEAEVRALAQAALNAGLKP